jgi:hypothetical protein
MPKVYFFDKYDIRTNRIVRSLRPATLAVIEQLEALPDLASESEVADDDLDGNGFLKAALPGLTATERRDLQATGGDEFTFGKRWQSQPGLDRLEWHLSVVEIRMSLGDEADLTNIDYVVDGQRLRRVVLAEGKDPAPHIAGLKARVYQKWQRRDWPPN